MTTLAHHLQHRPADPHAGRMICNTRARDEEDDMWGFLLGGTIGYVLGSRAGRERYQQIERMCRQVIDHPAVQGVAGVVSAKINDAYSQSIRKDR